MIRRSCRYALVLLLCRLAAAPPAHAQILEAAPQPYAFPVLSEAEYKVDPLSNTSSSLFRVADRTLALRSTTGGDVDLEAYCKVPDRHWGPVSLVGCTLEISGRTTRLGPSIPSRIALSDLPVGSTVKLRLLLQAPLIVLDLEGNPTAIMDTFIEEHTWRVTAFQRD